MANDSKAWDLSPQPGPHVGPDPTVRKPRPLNYIPCSGYTNTNEMRATDGREPTKSPTVPDMVSAALRHANEAHEVASKIESVLSGTGPEPCCDSPPKDRGPVTSELHDLNEMLAGLVSRLYSIATTLGA